MFGGNHLTNQICAIYLLNMIMRDNYSPPFIALMMIMSYNPVLIGFSL